MLELLDRLQPELQKFFKSGSSVNVCRHFCVTDASLVLVIMYAHVVVICIVENVSKSML